MSSFYRFSSFIAAGLLAFALPQTANAAETAADQPPVIVAERPGANETGLIFQKNGMPETVIRQNSDLPLAERSAPLTPTAHARAIVQALVDGPTPSEVESGIMPFLPEGTALGKVEVPSSRTIKIYLDLPPDFVNSDQYNALFTENTTRHFMESLFGLGLSEFYMFVRDPATGDYKEILDLLPQPEPMASPADLRQSEDTPSPPAPAGIAPKNLPNQNGVVSGALTGKRVVLNDSHGWYDNTDVLNRWAIQRTLTWEVLEDFSSAMFVNHYVIPMLQNAGAIARPVREADTQTNMVVIDNAMGAPKYTEVGTGWFSSALKGYTHKAQYVGMTDNPFGATHSTRLIPGSTGAPTASATFTSAIPSTGYYNVYISYAAGTDRTPNAHWKVYHSGGVTDFRVDQTKTGATWYLLGNFYFEQNAPSSQAKVVALNDSGDTKYLNVDAVRLGGGMGNVARRSHGVSGRPRWQEEATSYLQYNGMLNSGIMQNWSSSSDVSLGIGNRPRSAQWEQVRDGLGANLVYIGWHTNASTWNCTGGVENQGTGRGTLVIRDVDSDASAATKNLTQKVRDGMFQSVRASYNSSWPLRGGSDGTGIAKSNGYGEANQAHLGSVAGFFFEGLFHDNIADSSAYKDGKFRYAAARGIVNGLIQYYGGTVFPPEPVKNFRVKNLGNNQVQLDWSRGPVGNTSNRIGSAATNFRLYTSTNGYGFDNGIDVGNKLSHTIALTPGELLFVRLAAVNNAGISIHSETLAVRAPLTDMPVALIVNGYHRDDQFLAPFQSGVNIGGCTLPRNRYREMDPRKYQSLNYTIQHAMAIAASSDYGIDSCSKDAVNLGSLSLGNYPIVFWIGGQEAEADSGDNVDNTALRTNERNAIAAYLEGGGNLFISGSEIAWDLGRSGVAATKTAFLRDYLKANYSSDSSNTYVASGSAGIFAGIGTVAYDSGNGNTYDVRFPDVLSPTNGSTACMNYSGGTGGVAAIQYSGKFGDSSTNGKLVFMGFGFETILSSSARETIVSNAVEFFDVSNIDEWQKF